MRVQPVPYRLEIVPIALVQGQKPDLSGAIDIAQRHANGMKQAKHIRRHGGSAAQCELDARKAELVSQRLQYQHLRERQRKPRTERDRPSFKTRDMDLVADIDTPGVDCPARPAGIEHPALDRGREALPLARSEYHHLHCEFADIVENLLGRFREIHHQRQQETDGDAEELLRGPGRGDIGKILHARLDAGRGDDAMRVVDEIAMGQHHALRPSGGAGGIGQHGHVVGSACLDQTPEPIGILGVAPASSLNHLLERRQALVTIGPHSGIVPVDHLAKVRNAIENREPFVHLLLILRYQTDRIAIVEEVFDFVRSDVGIQRDDLASNRERRKLAPEVLRLVLADNGHGLAAANAHRVKTKGDGTHFLENIAVGVFAPDAAILVPLNEPVRRRAGALEQQLRNGTHWQHQRFPSPRYALSTAGFC